MIKIEILSELDGVLTIALYYPIPDHVYNALSIDNAREPSGEALLPAEIALLKEGKLVERITTYPIAGKSNARIKDDLEKIWSEYRQVVKKEYNSDFSYTGRTLRDQAWS